MIDNAQQFIIPNIKPLDMLNFFTSRLSKKKIHIQFKNFWKGFNPKDHFGFLFKDYEFKISEQPDFIVFSCFNDNGTLTDMPEIKSNSIKIFYTAENVYPDMSKCDYAISFFHEDVIGSPCHFRIPNYVFRLWKFGYNSDVLLNTHNKNFEQIFKEKNKFCNFIYSNPNAKARNGFFKVLSTYKKVDSGGKVFNNIGSKISGGHGSGHFEKINFMKQYKFSIAFENSSSPGYTTEKIVEAVLSDTIPIYWGNPLVHYDFNPKRFISFYDCDCNFEKLRQKVKEVDENQEMYLSYLNQPFLHQNKLPDYLRQDYVSEIFKKIFG